MISLGVIIVLLYVVSLPVGKRKIKIICSKCYMEFGREIEGSWVVC